MCEVGDWVIIGILGRVFNTDKEIIEFIMFGDFLIELTSGGVKSDTFALINHIQIESFARSSSS